MIPSIFSLEIIYVVIPDPKSFFWLAASVADAAAVNPNGIKTLLASVFSTFLLKESRFLVMVFEIYLKIPLIVPFYAIEFLIILY